MSQRVPEVQESGTVLEFDWGGCQLTDRGSVDEIQAFVGGEAHYLGRPGIVEAIWLTEGRTPWPGPPFPRPVYRVHWRPRKMTSPEPSIPRKDANNA